MTGSRVIATLAPLQIILKCFFNSVLRGCLSRALMAPTALMNGMQRPFSC